MKQSDSVLVYSTDQGTIKPQQQESVPAADGVIRLGRETKGRKGKGVTTVWGFGVPAAELKKLAAELKKRCGTGGSVKEYVIEIQGDQRALLKDYLEQKGYKVKQVGG